MESQLLQVESEENGNVDSYDSDGVKPMIPPATCDSHFLFAQRHSEYSSCDCHSVASEMDHDEPTPFSNE